MTAIKKKLPANGTIKLPVLTTTDSVCGDYLRGDRPLPAGTAKLYIKPSLICPAIQNRSLIEQLSVLSNVCLSTIIKHVVLKSNNGLNCYYTYSRTDIVKSKLTSSCVTYVCWSANIFLSLSLLSFINHNRQCLMSPQRTLYVFLEIRS